MEPGASLIGIDIIRKDIIYILRNSLSKVPDTD
jgi:hypothetical protein